MRAGYASGYGPSAPLPQAYPTPQQQHGRHGMGNLGSAALGALGGAAVGSLLSSHHHQVSAMPIIFHRILNYLMLELAAALTHAHMFGMSVQGHGGPPFGGPGRFHGKFKHGKYKD